MNPEYLTGIDRKDDKNLLFKPGKIGALSLPNRLVRSATAECMADEVGRPDPCLKTLYQELVQGGVGLIITGHMYVHPSGRAHTGMTGIYSDELTPMLSELAAVVHREGGKVVAQINHGGMQCEQGCVLDPICPSAAAPPLADQPTREMTHEEIHLIIDAYAQAARRAKEAGFDGVQLHAAHGYLINQFLSPLVNKRHDEWGGNLAGRMRFLRAVCEAVRIKIGDDYPLLIKLGMHDGPENGLRLDEGVQVAANLAEMGIDGVEISGGIDGGKHLNSRPGIRKPKSEGYFRPLARRAKPVTSLPILLVGGFRSQSIMEETLQAQEADFISICRPLICEPDLPNRMRMGLQDRSTCISGNRCWPKVAEPISCKCNRRRELKKVAARDSARIDS